MTFDYKKNHENIQHYPFLWGPEAKPPPAIDPLGAPSKGPVQDGSKLRGLLCENFGDSTNKNGGKFWGYHEDMNGVVDIPVTWQISPRNGAFEGKIHVFMVSMFAVIGLIQGKFRQEYVFPSWLNHDKSRNGSCKAGYWLHLP